MADEGQGRRARRTLDPQQPLFKTRFDEGVDKESSGEPDEKQEVVQHVTGGHGLVLCN